MIACLSEKEPTQSCSYIPNETSGGASTVTQRVKLLPAVSVSHVSLLVQYQLHRFQFPANALGKHWKIAQVLGVLLSKQKT